MDMIQPNDIKQLSPLALAYIGDGIYELLFRTKIISEGNMPVNKLHKKTVSYVCAMAQSKAYDLIEDKLSEEELIIYKRGRNAHGNNIPKNVNPVVYRRATGMEALFGYLYLMKNQERINELFEYIFSNITVE